MGKETPLKAIRRCCLDCSRQHLTLNADFEDRWYEEDEEPVKKLPSLTAARRGVKECYHEECVLWPYRMGRLPPKPMSHT
jgi:hypothetical protein